MSPHLPPHHFASSFARIHTKRDEECLHQFITMVQTSHNLNVHNMYMEKLTQNIVIYTHKYNQASECAVKIEGSPTPQKGCTDFEMCKIYPDFTDLKRFH